MAKKKPYIGCSIKQLPDNEIQAAAEFACALNPVNSPSFTLAKLNMQPDKFAIAVMTSKFFGAGGVDLTVGFLSTASAALQEKILLHLNAWGQWCNVKFSIASGTASRAQVRISLGAGGYWSYLGTDVLRITQGQPTMNLQGFSLNTSEAEYRRVVRHEAGHTLGCPHEHARRALVARLDRAKTIAYFQATQGWSATETQQQVLTPIEESSLLGTPSAEDTSIMCYGLPASITVDGRAIPGGADVTASDGAFMGKVYPKAIVPPPPPPSGVSIVVQKAGTYVLQQ